MMINDQVISENTNIKIHAIFTDFIKKSIQKQFFFRFLVDTFIACLTFRYIWTDRNIKIQNYLFKTI